MSLTELYHYYNVELADPRINDKLLISSPWYLVVILSSYAYFVLKCGRRFMEKRAAYSLKTFIFYYNIFQIVTNAYIVYSMYHAGWSTEFTLGCVPVRRTNRPIDVKMINIVYITLLLKTVDLVETIVFVLRKKYNQISFLHFYHHISTVVVTYILSKYVPGGMLTMQMLINGSVHVIMYSYYLMASLGPSMQKVANTIKPHITKIQIIQFFFLLWHQSQMFLPSCPIPKFFPLLVVGNLFLNLILFINFYRKSYKKNA